MGTTYNRSHSPTSVSKTGPARTDVEDICDPVHALNELVQMQLEKFDRRYMELYEQHKRDKEQWTQQMQPMEQRMMTMYSYFKQMRSGGSLSSAQPPSPLPPSPPHSLHDRTPEDSHDISNTDDNQYS